MRGRSLSRVEPGRGIELVVYYRGVSIGGGSEGRARGAQRGWREGGGGWECAEGELVG